MTIEELKYNSNLYLIQVDVSTYTCTCIHKVVPIMPIFYWTSLILIRSHRRIQIFDIYEELR
jgi:hypothetical protein